MGNPDTKAIETRQNIQSKIEKDKRMEETIVATQQSLLRLSRILTDYICMDVNSSQDPVLKKRTKSEFYKDFNLEAKELKLQIIKTQSFFQKKHLGSYTLLMKIIDVKSVGTSAWFYYNLIVIGDVLHKYTERINQWNSPDDKNYKRFYVLEGDTSFLYDMCCDVSSFLYDLYMLKASEYAEHVRKCTMREDDNPFVRYGIMPKMMKTHKAHSRTLLDTCNGVLHRTFYKDDMNAIPLMTSIIRQMIELRFEELLGIRVIWKDESHTEIVKVVGSTYFELPEFEKFTVLPVTLSALKAIYGWASEYVHRGVSDYYWIIFYVEQYLLAFILGDTYMEENYYGNLKSKIATLFNVSEKHIMWRDNTNLRRVSSQRLEEVRKEIKNKGYWKFHEKENMLEQKEAELYKKKSDVYQALTQKKTFIYKIDGRYYIAGHFIFEECKDRETCDKYNQLITVVKEIANELDKEITTERLDEKYLRLFIPMFDSIREYCDEQERRYIKERNLKGRLGEYTSIEKDVGKMVNAMLSESNSDQTEQLVAQIAFFEWMSEQSIRFETLEKGLKNCE